MKKLAALVALSPSLAFAAVPAAITTQLSDGLTDTAAIAVGVTLIVFGIAVFRWLRSAK
jgi:heme/copper-type cytochrome/quinol oxidase subunit 2